MNTDRSSMPSRKQLLAHINEVSFAVNDISLYLNTHPEDAEALAFFRKYAAARQEALEEYERYFGPLTIDTADDSCSRSWQWIEQPFPWEEKGGCQ